MLKKKDGRKQEKARQEGLGMLLRDREEEEMWWGEEREEGGDSRKGLHNHSPNLESAP